MDVVGKKQRSQLMSRIRGKDTSPEMIVRRLVHSLGYRYRLHVRQLPGCPDLVFPSRRKVILVHGCFWHRHRCRKGRSMPGTRVRFWSEKLSRNQSRDRLNRSRLRRLGWRVFIVWECQLQPKKLPALTARLKRFLES